MSILPNFLRMAVCFSINHAAVTAVLSLANGLLGDAANYENGALYTTYAATAILLASGLIDLMGPRKSLIVSAGLYCVYVISFPVALIIPESQSGLETLVALLGGIVGGFAAGFLWTAQGTYFALNAKRFAVERDIELHEANNTLASIFAFVFLSIEVILKLLPLALYPLKGDISLWAHHHDPSPSPPLFAPPASPPPTLKSVAARDLISTSAYAVLAIVAVLGLGSIKDLREEDGEGDPIATRTEPLLLETDAKKKRTFSIEKATAALRLWRDDPTVLLLAPIQITFGMCATVLGVNITGNVVHAKFGKDNWIIFGALFAALVAGTAGLLQVPFKIIATRYSKVPLMLLGLCAFLALSSITLFLSDDALSSWGILIPLYFMQGIGRACYEGTNKAVYADFYPTQITAAFSNIVLANGLGSAVAFFLETPLRTVLLIHPSDQVGKAIPLIAFCSSIIAIICYITAVLVKRKRVE